jgi:ADP-ribose pyrophosphatase YjhB (NUDIX family)
MGTSLAEQLAAWSDRLRGITALGLNFCQNFYDRENYHRIQDIAIEMLAAATGESVMEIERLRGPIFDRPTPLVVGDAAVIDDAGQLLLIRRSDNGLWAVPGGALEVGETPAEGVAREALEETGVQCEPLLLVGVYDSLRGGATSRHHLYQFVFLCRPVGGELGAGTHAIEITDAGWFAEDALPEGLAASHARRIPDAFAAWRELQAGRTWAARFDR